MRTFLGLASLASFASAHFTLNWPVSRGFVESNMPNFPCGGFNTPSSNRTIIALDADSLPVDITFHHTQTAVSYLLALGSDPSTNYNITLGPTLGATGLGEFCLPNIALNSAILGANLTDGQNATLQVVTDGDTGGGLFACADITFTSSISTNNPSQCANNTGLTVTPFSGAAATRIANLSEADGAAASSTSSVSPASSTASSVTSSRASSTASSTASSSSSSPTSGAGVSMQTASWGILGAFFLGCLAVL